MFGLFKKKTKKEILTEKYKKLLQEAFEISSINRKAADSKQAEAEAVLKEIEQLDSQ